MWNTEGKKKKRETKKDRKRRKERKAHNKYMCQTLFQEPEIKG